MTDVATGCPGYLRRFARHVRRCMVSGLIVLVPLGITIVVVRMLFGAMASFVRPLVEPALHALSPHVVTVISGLLFVLLVYLVGGLSAYLVGKRMVAIAEGLILRIPVVKSIYGTSKQVMDILSPAGRASFKSVVLVDFPRTGLKTIGFLMGTVRSTRGREVYKVFVPHAPNPTSGFLLIVTDGEIQRTNISVDDAVRMLLSGGAVSPDELAV